MDHPFVRAVNEAPHPGVPVEAHGSTRPARVVGKPYLLFIMAGTAISLLGSAALVATGASAQIQQQSGAVLNPAETDPVRMGWMQGSPPPPEKVIKFEDGSFGRFPQTRCHEDHSVPQ